MTLQKRGDSRYGVLILQMTDRDVVERFAAFVGGEVREVTVKQGHKPLFRVQVNGERLDRLYEAWAPFLGARRKQRFEEVLAARTGGLSMREQEYRKLATKDVCQYGHPREIARNCRTCHRDAQRRHRAKVQTA